MRVPAFLFVALGAFGAAGAANRGLVAGEHSAGFGTITEDDVEAHLVAIASAPLEGRDTPSVGLARAGDYIIERFRAAGLSGAAADGGFRIPWTRALPAPKAAGCKLVLEQDGAGETVFELEKDYVPMVDCNGVGEGRAVFCGFGITAKKERYDDLKGVDLSGNIAVILDGEPRHRRRFEGDVVTPDADLHVKLKNLARAGVSGVILVQRPAPDQPADAPPPAIAFRHTWAAWNPSAGQTDPRIERELALAVVAVTPDTASKILGTDVLALAEKIDKSCKPASGKPGKAFVSLASATEQRGLAIDNVVGVLRGSDPTLADEYVIVGAHYDHVGVGVRGQIGYGADDNGSGTSAMLEIVEALAAAGPRRSIVACAFSGEEDGLLGSRELARNPPVPKESIVAMVNLDMIGRGDAGEVVVLGDEQNPDLGRVLDRAAKLKSARVKVITGRAEHLWERSDHYSFHEVGIPVLFFFEAVSETDNPDYHTWRDTIELVDVDKITRTARLAFNTAWILAEDDARPSPPRGSR
jgi:hypothetical protein